MNFPCFRLWNFQKQPTRDAPGDLLGRTWLLTRPRPVYPRFPRTEMAVVDRDLPRSKQLAFLDNLESHVISCWDVIALLTNNPLIWLEINKLKLPLMKDLRMTHLNGWKPSTSKGKAFPKCQNEWNIYLHEWLCFYKSSMGNEVPGIQMILCVCFEATFLLVQFRFHP